jgi:hypothetical protein
MFKWFRIRYPDQALTKNQRAILDILDNECTHRFTDSVEFSPILHVYQATLPFQLQLLGSERAARHLINQLPQQGAYIPRSIALIQSGADWQFFVGVRLPEENTRDVEQNMFVELLTRTNSARSQ